MKKQITYNQLKKTSILVFLMIMVSSASNAQLKGGLENFKLIDIKVGYSIPVGNYASTGKNDFESGYAKPGLSIEAGYYNMFTDVIGLGASLGINFHGYDASARRRAIYDNDPTVIEAHVEGSRYTNITITVGPEINARLSEELSMVFNVEAGGLFTFRPQQEIDITNQQGNTHVVLESISGTSFALNFGMAFRYHATERTGFSIFSDFFYGKPKYDYLTYQFPNWIEIKGKQDVMFVNVGMSLTYIIGY